MTHFLNCDFVDNFRIFLYTVDMKQTQDYTTLYSDEAIVVLNKRSGLLVAADRYDAEAPRLDLLAEKEFGKLFAVHRIDKDTSGIVIYAKTEEAHRSLSMQFENREVQKVYHCLVNGHPLWQTLHVDLKLLADGDPRHRTVVNKNFGKDAVTDFTLIGNCGPFSWIEARPHTGRTHQIRVHLAANGLCIVCDPLYSGNQKPVKLSDFKRKWNGDPFEETPLLSRLALHAYKLTITHPVTGEKMTFTAPYPKDMDATRNQLAKIFKVDPLAEE
jgi:RluA family pseudouridine synthase